MRKARGQITIFIILAIVIVTAIIAALLFFGGTNIQAPRDLSPREQVEKCVRDAVEVAEEKILEGGGVIQPTFYKLYGDEPYNYLCYQNKYYLRCVNQYPQFREIVEAQIMNDTQDDVQGCFESMENEYSSRGFDIQTSVYDYNLEIVPGRIDIELSKDMTFSDGETTESFSDFDTFMISPLNDLIDVTRDVVNQEALYCGFDYNSYMLLYPQFSIKRIFYDESRIYIVQHRRSGKTIKFAVRSCVFAPGI